MNGNCVAADLKCDGEDHCGDNSDETYGCIGKKQGNLNFNLNVLYINILNFPSTMLIQNLGKPL